MKTSILIPYRPSDCIFRKRNFEFVRAHIEREHPDCEIIKCDDGGEVFSRAASLNEGAKRATGDVFVIHDADVIIRPERLVAAVTLAARLGDAAGIIMPFSVAMWLTRETSGGVLVKMPGHNVLELDRDGALLRSTKIEVEDVSLVTTGLANVITRANFETLGGFDARFRGWGPEDKCFAMAAETLIGPTMALLGRAFHLWHPYDPTRAVLEANPVSPLYDQYLAAGGYRAAMRALRAAA